MCSLINIRQSTPHFLKMLLCANYFDTKYPFPSKYFQSLLYRSLSVNWLVKLDPCFNQVGQKHQTSNFVLLTLKYLVTLCRISSPICLGVNQREIQKHSKNLMQLLLRIENVCENLTTYSWTPYT